MREGPPRVCLRHRRIVACADAQTIFLFLQCVKLGDAEGTYA